jgi:hypothetical protein
MTLPDEPPGWRLLQAMAQYEPDPAKVASILAEMNRLLDAHERSAAACELQPSGIEET